MLKGQKEVNTSCKECCFAIYEYDNITQTGCQFDLIDKFRSNGSTVLDAYDNEKEFNVIVGKQCPNYRTRRWLYNTKEENTLKRLEFENQISTHVIVFSNNNLDDLSKTLESIKEQTKKPTHLTVVQRVGKDQLLASKITSLLEGLPFKWRLQNMLEEKSDDGIVHELCKFIKHQYYVVINARQILPNNFLKSLNNIIMKELEQFAAIYNHEQSDFRPYVIPFTVHAYWAFHGNPEKTILDNILEYEKTCQQKLTLSTKYLLCS